MLNRRHIRIKVLQILYAFFHSESEELTKSERDLNNSLEKAHSLYVHLLLLLVAIKKQAEDKIEKGKNKLLPTQEDLSPNTKFTHNNTLTLLAENLSLIEHFENEEVYWDENPELVGKIFRQIQESETYANYINDQNTSFLEDRKFVSALFMEFIAANEDVHTFLEEKSIYWLDDFEVSNLAVIKTIKSLKPESDEYARLQPLFKDEEDRTFASNLLKRTILNSSDYTKYIVETASNWDEERISDMDQLLMQMAICELLNFETIPVKVTLNEYIELSKDYSSQKSKIFINGVIDKLAIRFKEEGILKKLGRGLV
tara:strand:- start:5360 stop:6301 length:942 start_codon:yes stop_codon:yes gene_type:complete